MLNFAKKKRTSSASEKPYEDRSTTPEVPNLPDGYGAQLTSPAVSRHSKATTTTGHGNGSNTSLLVPDSAGRRPRTKSDASQSQGDRRSLYQLVPDAGPSSNGTRRRPSADMGEGSLTFDQISAANQGRTLLVQAPELHLAEPSPELPSALDDDYATYVPLPTSSSFPSVAHRPTFSTLNDPRSAVSLPTAGRPRAATTSEAYPHQTFLTTSAPSSPPVPTTSLASNTSRPGSRSGSVTSQGDSSSSNLLAPKPPTVRSPSATRKKSRPGTGGSGGIAGALALSGVALASPSVQLRQPIGMAALTRIPTNLGRESMDTESDNGGSVYNGGSVFGADNLVSMDALGDFDDVVSQLGTGYAVASSKRNAEFHAIFKNIPDDDYLIEDYGCALQREILIQGRLYISEHHLSFNANIFGWVTTHTLPFAEIAAIEKRMTAYVIPNAIQVTTLHARYTFASFLARDTTHDLICNIWRMVHPVIPPSASIPDNIDHSDDDDGESFDSHDDGDSANRRLTRRRLRSLSATANRQRAGTGSSSTGIAPPNPNGVHEGDGKRRPNAGSPRPTRPDLKLHPVTIDTLLTLNTLTTVCMDTIFPSAPEKIYNLMFTSGFMKDFWSNNQKLLELQISDWAPEKSGSNLLARTMSYIKPLNGSIGPKQTKCLLTDESAHVDFDDYVCVITTTRTPDVPSGSAFAVKTRTSMTWAKGNSCRVLVTTGVEWTKSSFIKGIIERSCIDGQKAYHTDLEKSMRAYIHLHRSEFLEEGQEPETESLDDTASVEEQRQVDEGLRPSLSVARADETAADNPFLRHVRPLLDLAAGFGELFGGMSPATAGLSFVVAVLVLSNAWTLSSRHDDDGAYRPPYTQGPSSAGDSAKVLSSRGGRRNPDEIAVAVRGALHDYFEHHPPPGSIAVAEKLEEEATEEGPLDPVKEAVALSAVLDDLEARTLRLRGALAALE